MFNDRLRLVIMESGLNQSYNSYSLSLSNFESLRLPKNNEQLNNDSNYIKKSVVIDYY